MKLFKSFLFLAVSLGFLFLYFSVSGIPVSIYSFLASFEWGPADKLFQLGSFLRLWWGLEVSIDFAFAWAFLAWLLGLMILRFQPFHYVNALEEHLVAAGLGFGILSLMGFAMGVAHLYSRGIVMSGLAISLPLLAWANRERIKTLALAFRLTIPPLSHLTLIFSIIAAVVLGFHFLGALLPPASFDEMNYQLALPKLFIMAHHWVATPFNHLSFLPQNLNMLYLLGLLMGGPVTAKLFSYGMGILAMLALFIFGRRWAGNKGALIGAVLFVLTPVIGNQFRNAVTDLGCGFYELVGIFLLLRWFENPKENNALIISTIFWGLALGCKYTAIPGFLLATGVFVFFLIRKKDFLENSGIHRGKTLFLWLMIPAALASPWLVRNWIETGNPLAPLFSQWIRSRNFFFAGQYQPLVDYSAGIGIPTYFPVHSILDAIKLPWALLTQYNDYNHHLGPVFLLGFVLFVFSPRAVLKMNRWLLAITALFWLAWWMDGIHITRYFVAGLGLTCLIMGHLISAGTETSQTGFRPKFLSFLVALPFFLALAHQAIGAIVIQNSYKKPWGYLAGRCSPFHYLDTVLTPDSPMAAYGFIEDNLPPQSKILVVNEFRTFYLDRIFVASTPWDHDYWHEMVRLSHNDRELRDRLKEMGITHVLINDNYVMSKMGKPYLGVWTPEDLKKSVAFQNSCFKIIYSDHGVRVAEILP